MCPNLVLRLLRGITLVTWCLVSCVLFDLLLIFDLFFYNYLNEHIFYLPLRVEAECNL